jgi:hypothetical protein
LYRLAIHRVQRSELRFERVTLEVLDRAHFINEEEHAGAVRPRCLADLDEQLGEVVAELAAVGHARHRRDIDLDSDPALPGCRRRAIASAQRTRLWRDALRMWRPICCRHTDLYVLTISNVILDAERILESCARYLGRTTRMRGRVHSCRRAVIAQLFNCTSANGSTDGPNGYPLAP